MFNLKKRKKLPPRYLFVFFLANLFIVGCEYNSEEDLYGIPNCSTNDVTYSGDVLPILDNNCFGCHAIGVNSGGVTLEGYDNVKPYVNSGQLLGAIQHDPDFAPMPDGAPQLPDCDIAKVKQWIDDGAPEN